MSEAPSRGSGERHDAHLKPVPTLRVWTAEELEKYLVKPMAYVKGSKMAFAGVPKPEVRANIVAYILEATKSD